MIAFPEIKSGQRIIKFDKTYNSYRASIAFLRETQDWYIARNEFKRVFLSKVLQNRQFNETHL